MADKNQTPPEFKKIIDLLEESKKHTTALNDIAGIQETVMEEGKKKKQEEKGFLDRIKDSFNNAEQAAKDNVEYQKALLRMQEGNSAKDTEDKRESNRTFQKLIEGIQGMPNKLFESLKSWKDKAKEFQGTSLGKILMGAGVAALLAFMQSPYWEKFIQIVKDYAMPALQSVYDAIGPFGLALAGMAYFFRGPIMKVLKFAGRVLNILRLRILGSYIGGWLAHIKDMVKNLGGRIWKAMKGVALAAKGFVIKLWTEYIPTMWGHFKTMMSSLGGKLMQALRWLGGLATTFKAFMLTSFIPGMIAFFTGLGTTFMGMLAAAAPFILIGAAIGAALYALYESFAYAKNIFDETGSIGQAIAAFAIHLVTAPLRWIKDLGAWILGIFGFDEEAEALKEFDITKTVLGALTEMFDKVVAWVKTLFSDPSLAMTQLWNGLLEGYDGLMGLLFSPINKAINWVMEKFGWKTENEKEFDLWQTIKDSVQKIFDWFMGLFDIDIGKLVVDMLPEDTPDFVKRALGLPTGDIQADNLAAAENSGLYDKDMVGNSEIDRTLVPRAPTEQLQAILNDDDISDADKMYIQSVIRARQEAEASSGASNGSRLNSSSAEYVNGQGQPIVVVAGGGHAASGQINRDNGPRTRMVPVGVTEGDSTTRRMVEGSH